MQSDLPPQHDLELSDKLFDIVNELMGPHGPVERRNGLVSFAEPPFDISKPNQHDSKLEFEREFKIVSDAVAALHKLVPLFLHTDDEEQARTLNALEVQLDAKMLRGVPEAPVESITDLVRRTVADAGGVAASTWVCIDFFRALKERLDELEEQRDKFWNLPHRAPDYHARTIANRLAKLYARETGVKPTSGSSAVGGDASTKFTKALEQIFELLGIKSGPRSPADWAIKNLKKEDFAPKTGVKTITGLGKRPSKLSPVSILGANPERSKN